MKYAYDWRLGSLASVTGERSARAVAGAISPGVPVAVPARGVRFGALLLVAVLAGAGCTPFRPGLPSAPLPPAVGGVPGASGEGAQIAQTALRFIGVPYRYGGADPSRGFDCSGLVAYVHDQQGISVPRTVAAQFLAAQRVNESDLRPGDLVFFRLQPRSRDVTHVGIYTGQRRFVHAPQTGRNVGESKLDDEYYSERYAGSGRFYAASDAQTRGNPAGK